MAQVAIRGNTYPVKEQLKALGARWDAAAKVWRIDESKSAQAQAVVGGTKAAPRRETFVRCADCGIESQGYYRCLDCNSERRPGGDMYNGGASYRTSDGRFVLGADD